MNRALAAGAVVVALCTACSGDDAKTEGASPPAGTSTSAAPDTSALEAQVRAYSKAFLGGQGAEAYELLSQRCRERQPRTQFVQGVEAAAKLYGPQEIKSLTVDQASGDLARVTYTYERSELDQRGEPWTREGGQWRVDDC